MPSALTALLPAPPPHLNRSAASHQLPQSLAPPHHHQAATKTRLTLTTTTTSTNPRVALVLLRRPPIAIATVMTPPPPPLAVQWTRRTTYPYRAPVTLEQYPASMTSASAALAAAVVVPRPPLGRNLRQTPRGLLPLDQGGRGCPDASITLMETGRGDGTRGKGGGRCTAAAALAVAVVMAAEATGSACCNSSPRFCCSEIVRFVLLQRLR